MNNHEQTRVEKQSWLNHRKAWLDRNHIKNIFRTLLYLRRYFVGHQFLFSDISLNVSTWNLFRSHSPQLIACIRYPDPVVSRDNSNQGSVEQDGSHFGTILRLFQNYHSVVWELTKLNQSVHMALKSPDSEGVIQNRFNFWLWMTPSDLDWLGISGHLEPCMKWTLTRLW